MPRSFHHFLVSLRGVNMQSSSPVFPFKKNSSICVVGATGSGKSRWVYQLLRHLEEIFEGPAINDVLYCYGVYQELFDDMSRAINGIRFQEGLPSPQDIEGLSLEKGQSLLVLDDLMSHVTSSEAMSDLFCQFCHHKNISVIYLTQNLFHGGKCARTIALNTSALVLMKGMRNSSQIRYLAGQIYPGNTAYLLDSYKDAVRENFGYLVVDMAPATPDLYRLRTHIFSDKDTVVYTPASGFPASL